MLNSPSSDLNRSYYIVTNTMDEELPHWMNKVLDYIASPGVIIPLILLLV